MKQKWNTATAMMIVGCLSFGVWAQTVRQGDKIISFGIGVGQNYTTPSGVYYNSSTKHTSLGPITASYQQVVTDVLGVGRISAGGTIGMSFHNTKYTTLYGTYKSSTTRTILLARAAYHFDLPVKNLDLYAGMGMGIYLYSYRHDADLKYPGASSSSTFVVTPFGGARYFFSNSFGVYAELGYGLGILNVGMTLKL